MEEIVFSFAVTILGAEDKVGNNFFLLWEILSAILLVEVDFVELSLAKGILEVLVGGDWKLLETFRNELFDCDIKLGFWVGLELIAGFMALGGGRRTTGLPILTLGTLFSSFLMLSGLQQSLL